MENLYELMLLNKADSADSDGKKILAKINGIIEGKGKVIKTVSLGKKTLAYRIKKQSEGTYLVLDLNLLPSEVTSFSQKLSREGDILRFLILRREEKPSTGKPAEVKKVVRKKSK